MPDQPKPRFENGEIPGENWLDKELQGTTRETEPAPAPGAEPVLASEPAAPWSQDANAQIPPEVPRPPSPGTEALLGINRIQISKDRAEAARNMIEKSGPAATVVDPEDLERSVAEYWQNQNPEI